MFKLNEIPALQLGITGLEAGLTEEEQAVQEVAHRFAAEVMRPLAEKLDKMPREQVAAPDSPIYEFLQKLHESGIFDLATIMTMDGTQKARLMPLIFEQLGWGDAGLSVLASVTAVPAMFAYHSGDPELIEQFGSRLGCGIATQPDRGSDFLDMAGDQLKPGSRQHRGNLTAKIDGDQVILNGQSSAWVSGAGIAQIAWAFVPCDYGDGILNENGTANCIGLLVDLEQDGVSKGQPLDAIGQRTLAQCEIFFDQVSVPKKNITAGKDNAEAELFATMCFANMEMGSIFTGVAQAAYDHTLAYCHERVQGGVPIIEHQSVQTRLFNMWQKVEAARALSRRVSNYNLVLPQPHFVASGTSKSFVTRVCFEVATEGVQLFGANGLTKEYPIEKLFRDAHSSTIEDGENTMIGLKVMGYLSRHFKQHNH